jgi:hypothetical protein
MRCVIGMQIRGCANMRIAERQIRELVDAQIKS